MPSITPLTMMPAGAKGERAAAFPPWPIITAIQNAGIPTWPATAIPIGAISAVEAMLPGPMDDRTNDNAKNMIGIRPTLPLHRRTAFCAIRSRVPLAWACENSSVTPAKVRNRRVGKPAITSRALMSATYTPTIHASAMARNPTCSRIVQLTTMAIASATSDRVAASRWRGV